MALSCSSLYSASPLLISRNISNLPFPSSSSSTIRTSNLLRRQLPYPRSIRGVAAAAEAAKKEAASSVTESSVSKRPVEVEDDGEEVEEVEVEVEEDLPWIQEKALDLVEFTGSVTQALPGPRVGRSSLPLIVAVPLGYAVVAIAVAAVKAVAKQFSPETKRRRLVTKNARLCKSIDELLQKGRGELESALNDLAKETGFNMEEILRKYIRYALNDKPFNPYLVSNLIELRKATLLDDIQVAEVLNEISRRIVREKGPVIMDLSGYSERGFKRKLVVKVLFSKVFYLSELPEFCSRDGSLTSLGVKEIFGVTDEDADELRAHTQSESGDMDSLERIFDGSDSEELNADSPDS